MKTNHLPLAALAGLAHRALNEGGTEYARNKALIAQFFRDSGAPGHTEYIEEVRLTLIDSLYSTQVAARRLYGITDIAAAFRAAFPSQMELKQCTAQWIESGFETANPLYGLFAANYGVDKSGKNAKSAVSLLSKHLYFAAGCAFPIYDALGAKYHYIAGKKTAHGFQRRFRTLKEILAENGMDEQEGFDKLDNFFWLYGKIETGSFSLVLNQERYAALTKWMDDAPSDPSTAVERARAGGQYAAKAKEIFGDALYEFIQNTRQLDKE
jgi:hypothetical protein